MSHVHCSSSGSYAPVGSTTTFHFTPKVHTSSESLKSLSVESRHCRKVLQLLAYIRTSFIKLYCLNGHHLLHQITHKARQPVAFIQYICCKVDIAFKTLFQAPQWDTWGRGRVHPVQGIYPEVLLFRGASRGKGIAIARLLQNYIPYWIVRHNRLWQQFF